MSDQHATHDMEMRIQAVTQRIEAACTRVGRNPDEVRLMAVAKTRGPEAVEAAVACGIAIIGENRVQEARQKIPYCSSRIIWHMIGHLQRNKVRPAIHLFSMLHGIDSLSLLESVEKEAAIAGRTIQVCLQVNVSGEASKFGLAPESGPDLLLTSTAMRSVDVVGLMTIPPFSVDPESSRQYFRQLREYRDEWAAITGIPLSELSMGMSADFEVAIEEGATIVRLGSAIFGSRKSRPAATEAL